mgnify:CR=1 FL=1
MRIRDFQKLIESIYYKKDRARGVDGTFRRFVEEVGELARAIRHNRNLEEEFSDVFAWLSTLASLLGIDLEKSIEKYKTGCPRCKKIPCICKEN